MDGVIMPKVIEIQPGPHTEWSFDGTVLTAGSGDDALSIDLAERQADSNVIIDICRCPDGLMEGVCGEYVLSVEIPPRRYRKVERESAGDGEESGEPGGFGGWTGPSVEPEPFDAASVTLRLWTVSDEGAVE